MASIISVTKFGNTFGPKGDACMYIRYAVDCDRARWADTKNIVTRKYNASPMKSTDRQQGLMMLHALSESESNKDAPVGGVVMYAPRFDESSAGFSLLSASELTRRVLAFTANIEDADQEAKKLQAIRKMAEKEGLCVESLVRNAPRSTSGSVMGEYEVKVSLRCPLSDANYDSPLAQKWKARGLHSAGGCANFYTNDSLNIPVGQEEKAPAMFAASKTKMRGYMRQKLVHTCLYAAASKVTGSLCSVQHRSPDIYYRNKPTLDKYGLGERSATLTLGTYESRGSDYVMELPDNIDEALAAILALLDITNPERKAMIDQMKGPPEVKVDPVKAEMERRAAIEKEKEEKKEAQKDERARRKALATTWEKISEEMADSISPAKNASTSSKKGVATA